LKSLKILVFLGSRVLSATALQLAAAWREAAARGMKV
jgi:hypothetical protein